MTSAGLVFLGALSLAELLLILLIARKVRQLDDRCASGPALPAAGAGRPWLEAGTQIPPFRAQTTSSEPVGLEQLLGQESLVGFFSPGCRPCREQLPALAIVVGPAGQADEYLSILDGVVPVVREEQGGPVTTAFAARAFPGVFLLDPGGKVVASGASVARVVAGAFAGEATASS
jgi:hypothetical protein